MPFVVDASVAACWLLPDERSPVAEAAYRRIARDPAIVPGIWLFEPRNMLIVNERRGRINSGQTARALHLLSSLPVETDMSIDEESLMRLARMRQLTVYDAAYLELSLRRNIALATLDAKLAAAGRAEAVLLIGEER